jgi:hypothetical protein
VVQADDPENALDDTEDSSGTESSEDGHEFVFRDRPRSFPRRPLHPPPIVIHQLWDIFVQNVDPLSKVVHVPTLKPAFQKAASDSSRTIPRGFEALMFAIYGTAVMSLKDTECQARFAEGQKPLLLRYTRAAERALSRARFMGTTNLTVLQALVLHLLAVRDIYEPRALYSLTGVAIRAAQMVRKVYVTNYI